MVQHSEQLAAVPEAASVPDPRRVETPEQTERERMLLYAAMSSGPHHVVRVLARIGITRASDGSAVTIANVDDVLAETLATLDAEYGDAHARGERERVMLERYAPELAAGEYRGELALDVVETEEERRARAAAGEYNMALEDVDEGVALARAARVSALRGAMAMTGIRRLPSGMYAIGSPTRPEDTESVRPISRELAHAFMTAYLRGRDGHWRADEEEAFFRDLAEYCGVPYDGIPLTDADIIVTEACVEIAPPPQGEAVRVAAAARSASAWWREMDRDSVYGAIARQAERETGAFGERGGAVVADLAAAAHDAARGTDAEHVRSGEHPAADIAFAQRMAAWIEDAAARAVHTIERIRAQRGDARRAVAAESVTQRHRPTIERAVADAVRSSYDRARRATAAARWSWLEQRVGALIRGHVEEVEGFFRGDPAGVERRRLAAGWSQERLKGVATVGVAELRHCFGYARAAHGEASAIAKELEQMVAANTGATVEQRDARREAILARAEERLIERLADYRDQYGDFVLDPERLDRFRVNLRERLITLESAAAERAARELRTLILRSFDPAWFKRGLYGLAELSLVGRGVNVLVAKWLATPLPLPAARTIALAAPKPSVVFLPPEAIVHVPTDAVSPLTKSIWYMLEQHYPGTSDAQLTAATRAVLAQNHLYDSTSGWNDLVRNLQRAGEHGVDVAKLPDGYPIRGIASSAVRAIMGVAVASAP